MHRNAAMITKDGNFPFLNAAKREVAKQGGSIRPMWMPDKRFLLLRAKPDHPDRWLVNRLISEFVPSDFVSKYVFNKQGFYTDYQSYAAPWKEHVVETLKSTYLNDKAALRKRLYDL